VAQTVRRTIIPNKGRRKNRSAAAASRSKARASKRLFGGHRPRTKPRKNAGSHLVGLKLNKGRKPARKGARIMPSKKKTGAKHHHAAGHKTRKNKGRKSRRSTGLMRSNMRRRKNAGHSASFGRSGMGSAAINGIFVIAGALGTKLITQMALQANNTGWVGYGVSALVGAVLWFATEKTLHNPAASAGVIAGTVVQIIIRLINDYTPFGQYVSQLGMGDYQAQAFLTPQVLVDPYNSAQIQFPAALRAMMAGPGPAPSTAAKMSASAGVSGFDPLYSGGRSELYG
jgi:hypothetical protein